MLKLWTKPKIEIILIIGFDDCGILVDYKLKPFLQGRRYRNVRIDRITEVDDLSGYDPARCLVILGHKWLETNLITSFKWKRFVDSSYVVSEQALSRQLRSGRIDQNRPKVTDIIKQIDKGTFRTCDDIYAAAISNVPIRYIVGLPHRQIYRDEPGKPMRRMMDSSIGIKNAQGVFLPAFSSIYESRCLREVIQYCPSIAFADPSDLVLYAQTSEDSYKPMMSFNPETSFGDPASFWKPYEQPPEVDSQYWICV